MNHNHTHEAGADVLASVVQGAVMTKPDESEVAEMEKVIFEYFGPTYAINAYRTPKQQDRELAETLYAAGYRKKATK